MTRRSFQKGHVSGPIRTPGGTAYVIRYRARAAGGKWQHKQETLYDLSSKKAAREKLEERLP